METGSQLEDGRIRPLGLSEWIDLPADEPGEWVDGWLVEEEVSSFLHELLVIWFGAALRDWLVPRGGHVVGSEFKLVVSAHRGRKPDLCAYLPGRRPPLDAPASEVPPDIAVEILSSRPRDLRRDRVSKLAEYARFGIRQYWLVDPHARTLEVYERRDGSYLHVLGATSGQVAVPGCEGLVLELTGLWSEVDRAAQ